MAGSTAYSSSKSSSSSSSCRTAQLTQKQQRQLKRPCKGALVWLCTDHQQHVQLGDLRRSQLLCKLQKRCMLCRMLWEPVLGGVTASQQSHPAGRYARAQACSCYQAEQAGPPRHLPPAQREIQLSFLGLDNSEGHARKQLQWAQQARLHHLGQHVCMPSIMP